jgi:hypothetical protein
MADKIVTNTALLIGEVPEGLDLHGLAQEALAWQQKFYADKVYLGISLKFTTETEEHDGWNPSAAIVVTGPKQYLGNEQMRSFFSNMRMFIIGAAWERGYKGDLDLM